jgi:hypothetical protein
MSFPRISRQYREKPCIMCGGLRTLHETTDYCPPCKALYVKPKPKAHKSPRAARLKAVYGISEQKYAAMLADQAGVCAICKRPETTMFRGKPRPLSVDHSHKTGKVRGLLCGKCNSLLGFAEDEVETLRQAEKYLLSHVDFS